MTSCEFGGFARAGEEAFQRPAAFVHSRFLLRRLAPGGALPFFGEHGYPCFSHSLRGHGGSPGRIEWALLVDYIADTVEISAALPRPQKEAISRLRSRSATSDKYPSLTSVHDRSATELPGTD